MKTEYRQLLMHIEPLGAAFFVTFRLYGSLPSNKVKELKETYEYELSKAQIIKIFGLKHSTIFNLRKK